jgi:hypothetical protein
VELAKNGANVMNTPAKKQGTGLAQFAATSKVSGGDAARTPAAVAADEPVPQRSERTRAKSEVVNLTVRLSRGDWERLHQLAVSEGASIQKLAVAGLSRLFVEKGLPGL